MNRMTEHSQETKIAILEAKVEHMMGHVKELTLRVRANEKVVASVTLLGTVVLAVVGAGYFAPKAESAPTAGEWIQRMRQWELEQKMKDPQFDINSALAEYFNGSDDPTEQEEMLQLPGNGDQQSIGWRYD